MQKITSNTTLYDNHGRPLNYLRLAVTDRCNLRCFYCMPEKGIKYLPKGQLLTYEEMERVVKVMSSMGIK
ncbi:MAG: cyclic pyranopterin phosphate synthase MoaA, partial [Bacteroidota bacterium]|nr:cyclic pyranopterin phosphate synthase MoaA [Bacteroidota bacterium]